MKLVMLGGTFNPPHWGHLKMADFVRRTCGYDKVVLVPSHQPAHKNVSMGVSPVQRLAMIELAAAEIEKAFVSDCEIKRKGVSYSLDTIRYLKENFPLEGNPGLIIGDDLLPGFHKWYKAELLAEEADLIVLHREDAEKMDFPYPHRYLTNRTIPLSSSLIREKVSRGMDISEDVPAGVLRYISSERLYLG